MLGGRPRVNHWGAGEVGPHPVPEMAAFFFDTGAGGDRLHGGAPGTNPLPWSTGTQSSCWYQCRELGGEMYLLRSIFMSTWGVWPAVVRPFRTVFWVLVPVS